MSEENKLIQKSDAETAFDLNLRRAKALASSGLLPKDYNGDVSKSMIIVEMAQRIGAGELAVAQNMHVIHGRPSWSSTFIIAAINACGRFNTLKFHMTGTENTDNYGCIAYTTEKATGELIEGPEITIGSAKKEGWYGKSGSKWQTLPDLMLRYRAAAFFGRLYAPEILMGMQTREEIEDFAVKNVTPNKEHKKFTALDLSDIEEVKEVKEPTTYQESEE